MENILHILINDESEEVDKKYSVYKFFDVLKRPFIQLKDINQLDYLISNLPGQTQVAIWVHPNANQRKETNSTTPGEATATVLTSEGIDFNLISRYPEDVNPKFLASWNKTAIDLNELGNAMKKVTPVSVNQLRNTLELLPQPVKDEEISTAIITGLYKDEFTNLQTFFEDFKDVAGFETAKIAKLKGASTKVIIDFQSRMGMVEAGILGTQIIDHFPIKNLIMVGVCGGRGTKGVNLLDILIPDKIFDYQTGKLAAGIFKPYARVANLQNKGIKVHIEDIKHKMTKECPGSLKEKCRSINILHGSLACGSHVVSTDGHLNEIAKFDEEVLGVEMESYGVALAAEMAARKDVKAIIIKSVMDLTDNNKTDNVKADASFLSASFAYYLIKDYLS